MLALVMQHVNLISSLPYHMYCHLWRVQLYQIFAPYLINGRISGKVIEHKICALIFFTTIV